MLEAQNLYLVGFVSQASFALTMTLLAWSDRRSRGMVWLALASATQLLATILRYTEPRQALNVSQTIGSTLLVVIFFCVYQGLRWFVLRQSLRTAWGPAAILASALLVAGCSFVHPALGLMLSRGVVTIIMALTLRMLWRPRFRALRFAARTCAVQMSIVLGIMLFRLFVDQGAHGPLHDLLAAWGRECTLVGASLLSLSFIALFVAEAKRRLHEETRTDALTGLCNRRAMEEAAIRLIASARSSRAPLALLMLDMDSFKALNDTWGHWLGDRALHALGSVLLTGTGTDDVTARMGGEEFAVLLPGQDMESAAIVGERLRRSVADLNLHDAGCTASLTVSVGVSTLHDSERTWADMLRRADKALYRAKREGRNRVIRYNEEVTVMETDELSPSGCGIESLLTGTES
ncbi:MAG TPA: diguanylate cyclase [Acidobacteriaceae bacterium]|jgi:diguanylate cyclase (GGDEF)-like protein